MKELQDIANLITIRDFLSRSVESLNVRLSREEIKSIQAKVSLTEKVIIERALKLDYNKLNNEITEKTITSEAGTEYNLVKKS
jgi:hypothetical protein